jgi:hemolysin III
MRIDADITSYSNGEEIAHTITHGIGVLLSIGGLVLLIAYSTLYGDKWHIISSSIYGATLILLYTSSTLYHGIPHPDAKRVLRQFDHAAIFLLIAGTYTPFTLVNLRGNWGWTLFGLVWGLAIVGMLLELATRQRYPRLSLALYLGLGWLVRRSQLFAGGDILCPQAACLSPCHLACVRAGGKYPSFPRRIFLRNP